MPRGRHRHSPPLHRLLPPSAIAGVSLVCAFGPWVFTQSAALRVIAAFAAATAVVGAAVMRRWDAQAGKQVADLTRARASDEWRHEERVAELETDLEESRELRTKLEQRLRAKRAELAGLRNEHAALLRRYATAETERASALEGRRLLEIEAASPTPALPPVPADETESAEETEAVAASVDEADAADKADAADTDTDEQSEAPAVFSPEGSKLFLRASAALKKFDEDGDGSPKDADRVVAETGAEDEPEAEGEGELGAEGDFEDDDELEDDGELEVEAGDEVDVEAEAEGDVDADADADADAEVETGVEAEGASEDGAFPEDDGSPKGGGSRKGDGPSKRDGGRKGVSMTAQNGAAASQATAPATGTAPAAAANGATEAVVQEDEAQGQPEAVDEHEHAAASTPARSAQPVQQPSGHFVAPTAVAVVPAAPVRRPAVEGGFDFFGNKNEPTPATLDAVQNEDLADVVGQEALAVHKAEAESEFKPADEQARGVGQVIDLTAHDETEQINLQGLRSAVS
ncbi:hypothetical protein ACQEWB_27020 [Streptomyces sp. CA-249302]|uniref:hypothetical protein n=1 Tax=Streptomyces sp. CA-249302 TaxID=3240058 RepID=UPI003D90B046